MNPALTIAKRAALGAANVILRNRDKLDSLKITSKRRNDFVSEVDVMAEQEIVRILQNTYPNHGIIGEEGGAVEGRDEYQWIIDPLDGTTNYLHGIPHYAISIALKHKNRLEAGLIYDPVRDEFFFASRGAGARLNEHRIRVRTRPRAGIEDAVLGTGFPFRDPQMVKPYLGMFGDLLGKCGEMRRAGSAALDLAYVAAGRLDGFFEIGISSWDMAAGAIIVQEAGGMVSDFRGGSNFLNNGHIVAASPKVFKGLLQTLQPHVPDFLPK